MVLEVVAYPRLNMFLSSDLALFAIEENISKSNLKIPSMGALRVDVPFASADWALFSPFDEVCAFKVAEVAAEGGTKEESRRDRAKSEISASSALRCSASSAGSSSFQNSGY